MPRGTAWDLDVLKVAKAKTVKKEGEETLAVWEPAAGKRFRLAGFDVFFSAEATLTLKDENTVIWQMGVPAKTNIAIVLPQGGYLSTGVKNKLNFETSAEGALTGTFYGTEDVA